MEESSFRFSKRLSAILSWLVGITLVLSTVFEAKVPQDLAQSVDVIRNMAQHWAPTLTNLVSILVTTILLIAIAAMYFYTLRGYENILAHFIGFGMLAAAATFIVTSVANLSMVKALHEIKQASELGNDALMLEIASIYSLKSSALQLGAVLLSATTAFLSVLILKVPDSNRLVAIFGSIVATIGVVFPWLSSKPYLINVVYYSLAFYFVLIGFIFNKDAKAL